MPLTFNKHGEACKLLTQSAIDGNTAVVVRLLSEGIAPKTDQDGRTPLHHAATNGHIDILAALISAKCSIQSQDSDGFSPLQHASANGHEEVIKLLLKHNGNPNTQDSIHGNTALHEASWKGYSHIVALLCNNGANPYLRNRGGFAPLHLCCQNGHNQSCRELLMSGCNPDIKNNYGDTPVHTSARYGHAGVMRILVSAKCNVSEQNKNGDTSLHIASAMCRRKLTRILLECGCDVNLKNKQDETASDIAKRKQFSQILEIFETPPPVSPYENNKKDKAKHKKNEKKRVKPDSGTSSKESSTRAKEKKHKGSKVRFEHHIGKEQNRKWSPYGCHYYPDLREFPAPNLDSLPKEPLVKGEQYFLDLAGNIRKGPIGVGTTCYCGPLLCHVSNQMHKDKKELLGKIDGAKEWLDQRLTAVEQRTRDQIETLDQNVKERFETEQLKCEERGVIAQVQSRSLLKLHSQNIQRWLQTQMNSQWSRSQTNSASPKCESPRDSSSTTEPVYKTLRVSDRPLSQMQKTSVQEMSDTDSNTSNNEVQSSNPMHVEDSIQEVVARMAQWESCYPHEEHTWNKKTSNPDVCSNIGTVSESVAVHSGIKMTGSDCETCTTEKSETQSASQHENSESEVDYVRNHCGENMSLKQDKKQCNVYLPKEGEDPVKWLEKMYQRTKIVQYLPEKEVHTEDTNCNNNGARPKEYYHQSTHNGEISVDRLQNEDWEDSCNQQFSYHSPNYNMIQDEGFAL